jgi:hypothetical protein
MMKILLIIGIITTIAYMMLVLTNTDRKITLALTSTSDLISSYSSRPSLSRRAVVVLNCENGLCEKTLKSILDQSVKVAAIAIETSHPEKIDRLTKTVATVHQPGTAPLREPDKDTVIFYLQNGKTYDYDYIEENMKTYKP